jgi:hypothetical protein
MKNNRNRAILAIAAASIVLSAQPFSQPFSRDEWGRGGNGYGRSDSRRANAGDLYEIVNVKNGKVVDLDRRDGRTVIQFEPRGTRNQLWEVRSTGGGRYLIVNSMNGAALAEMGPRRSTPVGAFPAGRRTQPAQEWRIESYRDGSVMLISFSGKALDIPNGTHRDGVQVQTYDRNGDGNQRFFLRPVSARGARDDGFRR